ncbi:MAG: CotH kinase family protein [Lachnospiraceae bacterium]|nr:CotH kinase family protein [Lachnospiraceae bacterium]
MIDRNRESSTIWKRILILLAAMTLLTGMVGVSLYVEHRDGGFTKSNNISNDSGEGDRAVSDQTWSLYVTNTTNGLARENQETRIDWWLDDNTGHYYVFLPAVSNLEKLRLGIDGASSIELDGEKIDNNELFSVTAGEHVFTLAEQTHAVTFLQSHGAGTVLLTTESGSMDYVKEDKANRESGNVIIADESGQVQYDGPLEYIHGRGNSTWSDGYKLPYTIKLSKKTDLFRMGAAKKWVLLANQWDDSLLRNRVVHDIAKTSGMPFTAESVSVDFYTNGEYQGNYQLGEKVEVSTERVNIPDLEKKTENVNPGKELSDFPVFGSTEGVKDTVPSTMKGYQIEHDPADITGGYLFTLNIGYSYLERVAGFVTSRNQAVNIEGPSHPSVNQVYYIANLYQELEDALYAWDGINPNTGKAYYDYIDVNSFAQKYLIEEITKNLDASIASQYMYKYPDSVDTKIYAGPVWDYDKSLGNGGTDGYNSTDLTDPNGMYASQDVTPSCIWYAVFFRPEFSQAVVENYYKNFRANTLAAADNKIANWSQHMIDSVTMNAIRWNIYGTDDVGTIQRGYAEEISGLKSFITERIAYLDTQWVQ